MFALRGAMLALGLSATLLVAGPADAAAPLTPEAYVGGDGAVVTDAAGNAIAVATVDEYEVPHFRYRHVNGGWSNEYVVPGLGRSLGLVTAGRTGMPLVVGHVKGGEAGLAATIRRTDATWTPSARLDAASAGQVQAVDVAGNADGDFAVSWNQGPTDATTGTTYAAIRLRGGSWHTYMVGGLADLGDGFEREAITRVGIDAYGNVTVARAVTSDGTTYRMLTRRKPVSGGWQAQNQVSVAGQSVRWLDMVIEPTGRETIAYQLFAAQSERYGPSYVRRQASVGGALGQVWQQAASSPPSIAAAGGRLRVVWSIAPDPGLALGYTQAFIPAAQPVRALNEATNLITGVTINKYGQGVAMTGYRYDALAYPVTDTSVGAGAPMDTQQQHVAGLAPVLGAGREYFVGVQTFTELPFEESLEVFRAQRP